MPSVSTQSSSTGHVNDKEWRKRDGERDREIDGGRDRQKVIVRDREIERDGDLHRVRERLTERDLEREEKETEIET